MYCNLHARDQSDTQVLLYPRGQGDNLMLRSAPYKEAKLCTPNVFKTVVTWHTNVRPVKDYRTGMWFVAVSLPTPLPQRCVGVSI